MDNLFETEVRIGADMSGLQSAIGGMSGWMISSFTGVGDAAGAAFASAFTVGATAGIAALFGGGALAVVTGQLASDAEEAGSKFGFVFGSAAEKTRKKLDEFSIAAGRSRYELRGMAADIGALIGPMGFSSDKAGELSSQVTILASDLASFFNATDADALQALRAGLIGESEPLRRFGVQLNEARIQGEAMRLGLAKTKAEVTGAVKAQAIMSIVMKDTATAQGDAIRTSGGYANTLRSLFGAIHDVGTEIGKIFLPSMTVIARAMSDTVRWIDANTAAFEGWGQRLGGITQNVIRMFGQVAERVGAFFGGGMESLLKSSTGGTISTFEELITKLLDIGEALTADFDKLWKGIKLGAEIAFNSIGIAFLQMANVLKAAASGHIAGQIEATRTLVQEAIDAMKLNFQALGIQAAAVFKGMAAAAYASIQGIGERMSWLGGVAGIVGKKVMEAFQKKGSKDTTVTDAFSNARAEVIAANMDLLANAQRATEKVGKSYAKGFAKSFDEALKADDFLAQGINALEVNRDVAEARMNAFVGSLMPGQDDKNKGRAADAAAAARAQANAAKRREFDSKIAPFTEWFGKNVNPGKLGELIAGGAKGGAGAVKAAGEGMGAAVAGLGFKGQQQQTKFFGAADFSKAIQQSIRGNTDANRHKEVVGVQKKVVEAVEKGNVFLNRAIDAISKIQLGLGP